MLKPEKKLSNSLRSNSDNFFSNAKSRLPSTSTNPLKLTPPRTPHLLRHPTPHQTGSRKKKGQAAKAAWPRRGFLGGASAFADSEMLPLRVFIFPKYQKNKNLTPKNFMLSKSKGYQGSSLLRFLTAVDSISLIRFSWLTSLAPGS